MPSPLRRIVTDVTITVNGSPPPARYAENRSGSRFQPGIIPTRPCMMFG